MGKVTVQDKTMKDPITFVGKQAGICWGSDISDNEKNFKRGYQCIKD